MKRQGRNGGGMIVRDRQPLEVVAEHLLRDEAPVGSPDVEFLEAHLAGDLPRRRGAYEFAIGRIADERRSGRAELRIGPPEPEGRVRVQQQRHSMYSEKSSRGVSKSGAIQNERSFAVPG